jgi:hypothetical protein
MPKYVIVTAQGNAIAEGLSEEEAAEAILSYDGQQWEITPSWPEAGEWTLELKPLNGKWVPTEIGAYGEEYQARSEIFEEVVRVSDTALGWTAEAIEQGRWDEMNAEMERADD